MISCYYNVAWFTCLSIREISKFLIMNFIEGMRDGNIIKLCIIFNREIASIGKIVKYINIVFINDMTTVIDRQVQYTLLK